MAHWNGTSGDISIGATAVKVTSWSATESAESLNVTDKASEGYREVIYGIKSLDISGEGNWDSAVNEGSPPLLRAGMTASCTLEIYDGGPTLTGSFLFTSVDYDNPTDGTVAYSFEAESTGAYTLPGGYSS